MAALRLIQERPRRDGERNRQLLDDGNRRIACPALDIADISPVDVSAVSKFLLAPTLLVSEFAEVGAEANTNVHDRDLARLQSINLQTMRDI